MTKKETMQLIFIMKAAYPKYFSRISEDEIKYMHEAWSMVMTDYPYEVACAGLKSYISSENEGFPPSPGQIIDRIHKLTERPEERLTESEAWRLVYKAVCNSIYNASEEFDKLPALCQRAVGSPEVLRQWAQEDLDSMSVIQSNFQRAYRTAQERRAEEKKLPSDVRALIDNMTGKMAITDGNN